VVISRGGVFEIRGRSWEYQEGVRSIGKEFGVSGGESAISSWEFGISEQVPNTGRIAREVRNKLGKEFGTLRG